MAANLRSDLLGAPTAVSRLWFGILAGPVAWMLQLSISYPLAQLSCQAQYRSQHPLTLEVIALAALAMTALGGMTSWNALRAVPDDASSDGGRPIDRARFMAGLGLLFTLFF